MLHLLSQLSNHNEKRDELIAAFIKQVLLMASSLFGILVSLHSKSPSFPFARISFSVSLALLSLGILCLTISLFEPIHVQKRIGNRQIQDILKRLEDSDARLQVGLLHTPKFYKVFEKTGYVSLVLSLISLTVYAIAIA